jgi:hypothetical protein
MPEKLSNLHRCAIADCSHLVPLNKLMCRKHWFQVPRKLQTVVTNTYVPGQERTGLASPEYIAAMWAAIAAVENRSK